MREDKEKIKEIMTDAESGTAASPTEETAVKTGKGKRKWIKSHKLLSVAIALIVLLAGVRVGSFAMSKISPEKDEAIPVNVRVATADYGSIYSTAPLSGRVSPAEEVALVPLAQGKIAAVNVKVGDYVQKGTLVVALDKGATAANVSQAKESLNVAKTTFDNMAALYAEGAVSKSSYDSARLNYVTAREGYNSAAEICSNYNVVAPISGYVTSVNAEVGGIAGGGPVVTIANIDNLVISTTASEYIASLLKIGDVVDIEIDGIEDRTFKGTVTEFAPVPAMGTLTYPITITIDNTEGKIMSGMFAEVRFKAEESHNVVCLPSDSVITKGGKQVVVTLDKNNIPSFVEVKTGIDNGEYVEITKGIKKGDTVVVSGMDFVTEGIEVKVLSDSDAEKNVKKTEKDKD
ncbi:MAG: efflux RND transporter periplasmic adaptor subunit [Clostridia bacterium]|nr:efflux RND transporter periplasmic adaptor subunit [Clostridia bacterium]